MKRSQINPLPDYFSRYIGLVDDVELDDAFDISLEELNRFDFEKCQQIGLKTYAPDKWTIADILQHLIDWERIFTYRAIVFARGVAESAPGHDENIMAASANASIRTVPDLVAELIAVRHSTRIFFQHLSDAALQKSGLCWQTQMSVLALGFTILGHQRHHFNIIRERYYPLV